MSCILICDLSKVSGSSETLHWDYPRSGQARSKGIRKFDRSNLKRSFYGPLWRCSSILCAARCVSFIFFAFSWPRFHFLELWPLSPRIPFIGCALFSLRTEERLWILVYLQSSQVQWLCRYDYFAFFSEILP